MYINPKFEGVSMPTSEAAEKEKLGKPLAGLWRNNPDTPEGKYLVRRRDGVGGSVAAGREAGGDVRIRGPASDGVRAGAVGEGPTLRDT